MRQLLALILTLTAISCDEPPRSLKNKKDEGYPPLEDADLTQDSDFQDLGIYDLDVQEDLELNDFNLTLTPKAYPETPSPDPFHGIPSMLIEMKNKG